MQNDLRKKETGTKIQLGGLLLKSGLTELLGIDQGDDLQLDFAKKDKAYILLGILADSYNSVKDDTSFAHYLSKGKMVASE